MTSTIDLDPGLVPAVDHGLRADLDPGLAASVDAELGLLGLLGAGGSTTAARVRRLAAPSHSFGIVRGLAAAAGIAVVLALPLALAAAPALAAVGGAYCPVSWTA